MLNLFSRPLYIIGNGFDLHHGIPSSYWQFGRYVEANDRSTYERVERCFALDDSFWNEFEERLAALDTDTIVDEAENFLVGYGAEDWSDAYHHDYQYEIEQAVDAISVTLRERFAEWIRQLPVPTQLTPGRRLSLDPSARFLNFNYTSTLQRLYGIPEGNILHIHGSASDPTSSLVLGHGWEPDPKPDPYRRYQNPEDADIRVVQGQELIDDYFQRTFKPTARIIEDRHLYFSQLADVTEILVMGHSLAEVDHPYFEEILRYIDVERVHWKVSIFGSDEGSKRLAMENFGISPSQLEFLPLSAF
ncbi:bacteriophage abortive infection AbiH family protein [Asticcacaulis sp. AND118]|uniref:bacteriophage abortive infection AbiH family protein n=1 Tax=Asticcacaulis sp. AND118 TaxID=2840468 RepID=UPI001CFFA882|nr:bacteriophage abortive infection AbiH family protein [Asticcacaulis sp. AND118]UDF05763.1 bacteriophage abortive infection AbiH family protein [Asticcacaulis sp. AND118]